MTSGAGRHHLRRDDGAGAKVTYAVKELFYTLQGEGAQSGRAAVFCRFSGCNLWSGRETDREQAVCRFCDTEFVGTNGQGGGRFADAASLADAIVGTWAAKGVGTPYVVFTGGEPLLQLDGPLLAAVRARGFECAVETNGTLPIPAGVDWVCVSPKAGAALVVETGDELKLVYPQDAINPAGLAGLAGLAFRHFWLQPMDGPARGTNTREAIAYCLANARWRFSLQMHKVIGID